MTERITRAEAARRVNYHYMADVMRRLEWDLHQKILTEGRIPEHWHDVAAERTEHRRVRVTLMVDEDVVKFFRAQGRGHTRRMNEVLRGWMHARLAGLLRGAETMDYFKRRGEAGLDGKKPGWGETQKIYEPMGEDGPREMSDEPGVPIGEERRAWQKDTEAWLLNQR
ncbi:BrnA antitoxin family protein [uncultured Paracoccus sp.]|uniref:BrnA antitoxin family protein n=1 Tax=uncultured Paracoccus sp. TaxID=189685 RepID=UPI002638086C|nr:BrnA antitoxin family protein [uncultured Paracoccus sp.]